MGVSSLVNIAGPPASVPDHRRPAIAPLSSTMPLMMRAGAFVRRSGAYGLGHVGWTFQYADGSYCDGSVENPAGTPISAPGDTGFWSQTVADPDVPMRLRAYDAFKLFVIDTVSSDQADKTVAWIATQPYLVIFRNCMDDTYDVLRSYGVPDLPLPLLEITPNRWFDQLSPAAQPVTPQALQQAGLLPTTQIKSVRAATPQAPEAPPWRTPGTPEWQALHEQLLRPTLEKRLAHAHGTPKAAAGSGPGI